MRARSGFVRFVSLRKIFLRCLERSACKINDDEILGLRATNASEIAVKLEIAAQRVEILDDCADLIRHLRDQVVEFGLLRKLRPITT
jgi:hypothetical protein